MLRALRWTAAAAVVLAIALAFAWAPAVARGADGAPLHRAAEARRGGHARARAHRRGTPLRITARIDGLPEGATPDVPALIVAAAGAVPQPMRPRGRRLRRRLAARRSGFPLPRRRRVADLARVPGVGDRRGPRDAHRSRVRVPGVHRDGAAP
jgi:hypothetical protein